MDKLSDTERDKRLTKLIQTGNTCLGSYSKTCLFCNAPRERGNFRAINGYAACNSCIERCKELTKELIPNAK